MNTRRVIEQGVGRIRVERCNEPALETQNARYEQLGPFRVDSLAASQTGVAERLAAVDANAPVGHLAGRAGHIIGIAWLLSTPVTAGTLTAQGTVNTTASGDAVSLAGTAGNGRTQLTTPIAFAEGDRLGVKHTTNAGFTPTPHVSTWLMVRYSATESALVEVI